MEQYAMIYDFIVPRAEWAIPKTHFDNIGLTGYTYKGDLKVSFDRIYSNSEGRQTDSMNNLRFSGLRQ